MNWVTLDIIVIALASVAFIMNFYRWMRGKTEFPAWNLMVIMTMIIILKQDLK